MKLNATQTHIKVPITSLVETGNVRLEYDEFEIAELANSIRRNGLLNPITVKPPVENEDGIKTYEVIAGHRRLRALKWLCEKGDDFSMVEVCIRTGDKWALQMIENIQRTDLTHEEKEKAISHMLEQGMSQKEIAETLSKPIQYISDIVAGAKVRKNAENAGVDTSGISTKALSQIRSVPQEEITPVIEELKEKGGTVKAATEILHDFKGESGIEIPEIDGTTFESSDFKKDYYRVYGEFDFLHKKHRLYLEGKYSNDNADDIALKLHSVLPEVTWFVEEA